MLIRSAEEDVKYVMYSREQIAERVRELGKDLTNRFQGEAPLMICVLRGAAFFFTDLCREMDCLMDMDFIAASSYFGSTKSSGTIHLVKDSGINMEGRHVIIVEDIIDSGFTLTYLTRMLSARGAASIKLCTLLDKPSRRVVEITADKTLFTIPDAFVIGYGLDCAEYYRNLPYIAEYAEQ
jgi:hypoxanthine phosphoribosyltransferase